MRLNRFLAQATGTSRRAADRLIESGRVLVNGRPANLGQAIDPDIDQVSEGASELKLGTTQIIIFNKPTGCITSRSGQGSATIYDYLSQELRNLKPAGRLDKATSGLLVLTNDGHLANQLAHPSAGKAKRYHVTLDRPIENSALKQMDHGVRLTEGLSHVKIIAIEGNELTIELVTGWNRQIRRTFEALGYQVVALERIALGRLELGDLEPGAWRVPDPKEQEWLDSL